MSAHTPGPWDVVGDDSAGGVPFIEVATKQPFGPAYFKVAEVCSDLDERTDLFIITDECRANAKLIAASPDLLACVEAVLLFHSGGSWSPEKQQRWVTLTGVAAVDVRSLCDHLRRVSEPFVPAMEAA